jgi:aryl-alcohol dehydrogenase-like predicted oxidoreductase
MRYRHFGRTGWKVSELGYGMWGIADWSGSDDAQSLEALQIAVDEGCNFFDTAWAYGDGHSERILARLLKENAGKKLYVATKVPPKNRRWPSERGFRLDDVFPPDYIREYTERSLESLGVSRIDLLQFHVWEDDWADDTRWQRVIADLKREGLIEAAGVSINRWEPWNALRTLRTGVIDAVQVIYNLFDQAPEDELFPVCRELDIGVIARVPFDEGSLTGTLTRSSRWPKDDYRATYFGPDNLDPTMDRVEALERMLPAGMSLAELAIRFILSCDDVDVVIPGMRKPRNVRANIAAATAGPLSAHLVARLRTHRWDREPAPWSA